MYTCSSCNIFVAIVFLNYKIFFMVRTLQNGIAIHLGNFNGPEHLENCNKFTKSNLISVGKISTCLLAVICLSVCYFPTIVLCVLRLTNRIDDHNAILEAIYLWEETFLTLNSTLNCLIFFYKNSTLRKRGIKIIKKCFCSRLQHAHHTKVVNNEATEK